MFMSTAMWIKQEDGWFGSNASPNRLQLNYGTGKNLVRQAFRDG